MQEEPMAPRQHGPNSQGAGCDIQPQTQKLTWTSRKRHFLFTIEKSVGSEYTPNRVVKYRVKQMVRSFTVREGIWQMNNLRRLGVVNPQKSGAGISSPSMIKYPAKSYLQINGSWKYIYIIQMPEGSKCRIYSGGIYIYLPSPPSRFSLTFTGFCQLWWLREGGIVLRRKYIYTTIY